jgi:hypothetical protein
MCKENNKYFDMLATPGADMLEDLSAFCALLKAFSLLNLLQFCTQGTWFTFV